jgi:hypothetical protein
MHVIYNNLLHCHARNNKYGEQKKEQKSKGKVEKGEMERKCLIRRAELLFPQRVGRGRSLARRSVFAAVRWRPAVSQRQQGNQVKSRRPGYLFVQGKSLSASAAAEGHHRLPQFRRMVRRDETDFPCRSRLADDRLPRGPAAA